MSATAAIFYHPDMIESAEQPLAGRRTAGQSFIAGLIRHVESDGLFAVANEPKHLEAFRDVVQAYGWRKGVRGALVHEPAKILEAGVLQVPGPNLASFAWTRRRVAQDAYSICGITHTVATKRIMQGLLDTAVSPTESWDAVICTSRAVRSVLATELDAVLAYLAERYGAARTPRLQLPVIPLGIDTSKFERTPEARVKWRAELGLDDDAIAIMSMGRRTISEKMHPGPLMIAAQLAAERTGRKVALWMVGWFGDKTTEALHVEMAREMAPDVDIRFPDGKDEDLRFEIWSAADIFALPVDNIQETYGLAPVEAMAAGLPVVVSDWDGFRDTVVHGETGFRIPTRMSRPGSGIAIAERYEDGRDSYHQYLVAVHQRTAIDVRDMADAFTTLIENPDRRAQMGAAGIARARHHYDWSAIIPQYEALWADLTARRTAETASAPRSARAPANPTAMDPFELYAGYPAQSLLADTRLSAPCELDSERIDLMLRITGGHAFRRLAARSDELLAVHRAVRASEPLAFKDLITALGGHVARTEACVLWLLKFDLLRIVP
ncbi:MAG: glycosyltransferase family 4 protein [Pseudomonadota bacterium]